MIKVIRNEFIEKMGYFKLTLGNNDKLLMTRKEYSELKYIDNHKYLIFESTGGNFYKPIVLCDNLHFINV